MGFFSKIFGKEEKEKSSLLSDEKIKNSAKTKLTNKKVSDTIKRSLIPTIGGLKVHMGMDKVKDKIKKMTGNQIKDLDFKKDREIVLAAVRSDGFAIADADRKLLDDKEIAISVLPAISKI